MSEIEHRMNRSKDGDWPEDFSHENGNYFCKCISCGRTFMGYKRRVMCKMCATPTPDTSEEKNDE